MVDFKLQFPEEEIPFWEHRYTDYSDETPVDVGNFARENGHLDMINLHLICRWKSSRRADQVKRNSDLTIKEITSFSFSTPDEYSKVTSLILLRGVLWPTASVILHFCVSSDYPILDVRALWSLGVNGPISYNFDFWEAYVTSCRELACKNKVSIRSLDKALWQFSKENQ